MPALHSSPSRSVGTSAPKSTAPSLPFVSPLRPQPASLRAGPGTFHRRATLRDLYTSGLVSVFRRHSVFRVWEPLRETPRQPGS